MGQAFVGDRRGVEVQVLQSGEFGYADFGRQVLVDLTTRSSDFADVVGPLTTGQLIAENLPLPRIAATLGAHHIVNARFVGAAPDVEILFELIRASDGAHIYVKRVSDLSAVDTVAETIVSGMLAALEVDRSNG